jgi:hypothetical protein
MMGRSGMKRLTHATLPEIALGARGSKFILSHCGSLASAKPASNADGRDKPGHHDAEAFCTDAMTRIGTSPARRMRPDYVIAIGQPLLPVAPLIGAGAKQ